MNELYGGWNSFFFTKALIHFLNSHVFCGHKTCERVRLFYRDGRNQQY